MKSVEKNARCCFFFLLVSSLAQAAIVPGLVFRSKATNTQVEIKYDGATLTVPQHCRQSTCDATQAALAATNANIDREMSALKTATTQYQTLLTTCTDTSKHLLCPDCPASCGDACGACTSTSSELASCSCSTDDLLCTD